MIPRSIFQFLLKYSLKQQIFVVLLTFLSFPILYITLELPKQIINGAISHFDAQHSFIFMEYKFTQLEYLIALSAAFLLTVIISGALKMSINIYKGSLGERMLQKLRFMLYHHLLRFPISKFKTTPPGQIIPMITTEVEPLGGFIGDAFALPIFQGGTLLVYISFIFMQNHFLGLAAISFYPIQAYLIPKLQLRINMLAKRRIKEIRLLSDEILDTLSAIEQVHLNAMRSAHLAKFAQKITTIFNIRFKIFRNKYFMKFLNNFLNQLTPFFFYSIGGYFVIKGQLSIGALVAVLAAYKDLSSPWKELLRYYQDKENVRIKYEQIIKQFNIKDVFEPSVFKTIALKKQNQFEGPICFKNVTLRDEGNQLLLKKINYQFSLNQKIALTGDNKSGKIYILQLLARLQRPSSGSIIFGQEEDYNRLPFSLTGKNIAYLSKETHIFNRSIFDNLTYGLIIPPAYHITPNNGPYNIKLIKYLSKTVNKKIKIDYERAGVKNLNALEEKILELAKQTDFCEDLYNFGLHMPLTKQAPAALTRKILHARKKLAQTLKQNNCNNYISHHERQKFNPDSSLIENIVFGAICKNTFPLKELYHDPYLIKTLKETGLYQDLTQIATKLMHLMLGLFENAKPGNHFFDQYDFITIEALKFYKELYKKYEQKINFSKEEEEQLIAFCFNLIPSRHRLGLIDDKIQKKIIKARDYFIKNIPARLQKNIRFFDSQKINEHLSILNNILFGTITYSELKSEERVYNFIHKIIKEEKNLFEQIQKNGLLFYCGPQGNKLTLEQKQKIQIIAALLKNPRLLLIDQATLIFDASTQEKIHNFLIENSKNRALIWSIDNQMKKIQKNFDHILHFDKGTLSKITSPRTKRKEAA